MNENDNIASQENTFGRIENNIYKETFIPYTFNCDIDTRVNLDWIFEIVQESVGSHDFLHNCYIINLRKIGLTRVISREKIHIYKYPKWREKVFVETWAENTFRKVLIPRIVQAKNEKGELLFKATTLWAIIDLKTNKPILPDLILNKIGFSQFSNLEKFYIKKREVINENNPLISKFKPVINYSDTDINLHVNNISYLRWALRSIPNQYRKTHIVENIDVSWLKQTFLNEDVEMISTSENSKALELDNSKFYHQLIRHEKDGSKIPVFEASSTWKKRIN